ncbi:exported protein of unknown function [Burkholderia multivorans]
MKQIRRFAAALAACFSFFAFAVPAIAGGPPPQTEAAIKAENARWADAFARGDYEAIGRLYTNDGALLPPGGDRVTGGQRDCGVLRQGVYRGKTRHRIVQQ